VGPKAATAAERQRARVDRLAGAGGRILRTTLTKAESIALDELHSAKGGTLRDLVGRIILNARDGLKCNDTGEPE
jgi:hypothetical protein